MSTTTQRKRLVLRPTWTQRGPHDDLPDLDTWPRHVPGPWRCRAIGLGAAGQESDCSMRHALDEVFCYYHLKVRDGLLEPIERRFYPVLPLPKWGYVLSQIEVAA